MKFRRLSGGNRPERAGFLRFLISFLLLAAAMDAAHPPMCGGQEYPPWTIASPSSEDQDAVLWKEFVDVAAPSQEEEVRLAIAVARVAAASASGMGGCPLIDDPYGRVVSRLIAAAKYIQRVRIEQLSRRTTAELEDYITRNPGQFVRKPWAVLYQIFIPAEADTAEEDVRAAETKILTARRRLAEGEAFQQVARDMSQGNISAFRGGAVGTIYPDSIHPDLARVVFGMREGEIVGPIRSRHGFHIFHVTEISSATEYTPEEKQDLARTSIRREVSGTAYREVVGEATGLFTPQSLSGVVKAVDPSSPWLVTVAGRSYALGLVHAFCLQNGYKAEEITLGLLQEESEILKPSIVLGELAEASGLTQTPEFREIERLVELNRLAQAYWSCLRDQMNPTERELEAYFEGNPRSFPPTVLLTGALLHVPVIGANEYRKLNPLERHQRLAPVGQALRDLLAEQADAGSSQLLSETRESWPSAFLEPFGNAKSLGHIFDQIAAKIEVGQRSDPVENKGLVSVLILEGRAEHQPTLPEIRPAVVEAWRDDQVRRLYDRLVRALGGGTESGRVTHKVDR